MHETVTTGLTQITWDPVTRIASMRTPGPRTVAEARVALDALTRWVGTEGEPFAVIHDATGAELATPESRAMWAKFWDQHLREAAVAMIHAGPEQESATALFAAATGMRVRAFASEADGRGWLRGLGYPA